MEGVGHVFVICSAHLNSNLKMGKDVKFRSTHLPVKKYPPKIVPMWIKPAYLNVSKIYCLFLEPLPSGHFRNCSIWYTLASLVQRTEAWLTSLKQMFLDIFLFHQRTVNSVSLFNQPLCPQNVSKQQKPHIFRAQAATFLISCFQ